MDTSSATIVLEYLVCYHDCQQRSLQDYSVSFSRRPDIQSLIGDQAEFLVHTFCVMDLASLDATMDAPSGKHQVMARKQHGGQPISLTDQQYRDLITVQLADWLEQVHCAIIMSYVHPHFVSPHSVSHGCQTVISQVSADKIQLTPWI